MAEHLRNEEGALQAHEVVLAATTLPALDALPPHGHVAEATLDGEVLRLLTPKEWFLKSRHDEGRRVTFTHDATRLGLLNESPSGHKGRLA